MHPAILLLLGLVVLILAGEILVRGAVGIAKRMKVSTLVIGMTVVSFGTSAPELFVSIGAAVQGNAEIAIGNVVGSNIANLALVLAITALIFPLVVDRQSMIVDWPMMIFATALFWIFSLDGVIARWEGLVLFGILLAFVTLLISRSRRAGRKNEESEEFDKGPAWQTFSFLLGGLAGLYFGAEWLVDGAIALAKSFEVDEHIIAVTVVAFGTSVPELVASGMAAYKKETDISIGNLIGSNIFNIMAVVGITAIVTDIPVSENVIIGDMWWVAGIAVAIMPLILLGKQKIGRWQGALLLATYVLYVYLLIASAG